MCCIENLPKKFVMFAELPNSVFCAWIVSWSCAIIKQTETGYQLGNVCWFCITLYSVSDLLQSYKLHITDSFQHNLHQYIAYLMTQNHSLAHKKYLVSFFSFPDDIFVHAFACR